MPTDIGFMWEIDRRFCQIADLGIARHLDSACEGEAFANPNDPDSRVLDRATTFVGTVTYMSPERIGNHWLF